MHPAAPRFRGWRGCRRSVHTQPEITSAQQAHAPAGMLHQGGEQPDLPRLRRQGSARANGSSEGWSSQDPGGASGQSGWAAERRSQGYRRPLRRPPAAPCRGVSPEQAQIARRCAPAGPPPGYSRCHAGLAGRRRSGPSVTPPERARAAIETRWSGRMPTPRAAAARRAPPGPGRRRDSAAARHDRW